MKGCEDGEAVWFSRKHLWLALLLFLLWPSHESPSTFKYFIWLCSFGASILSCPYDIRYGFSVFNFLALILANLRLRKLKSAWNSNHVDRNKMRKRIERNEKSASFGARHGMACENDECQTYELCPRPSHMFCLMKNDGGRKIYGNLNVINQKESVAYTLQSQQQTLFELLPSRDRFQPHQK